LSEMCVVHLCNFDWPVKKAWMLPHPAHLNLRYSKLHFIPEFAVPSMTLK